MERMRQRGNVKFVFARPRRTNRIVVILLGAHHPFLYYISVKEK